MKARFIALLLTLGFSALQVTAQPSSGDLPDFNPAQEGISEELKSAFQAHEEGRFQEAFVSAEKAAQSNDAKALYFLGWLHESGRGTGQNARAALETYAKAQEAGSEQASYRRCEILLRGDDGQRKVAAELLAALSENDSGRAELILGEAHLRGLLSEKQDYDAAVEWWTKSAKKGETQALINLARLREGAFGFSEKADPTAALNYLAEAAALDDAIAMAALGSRYLNGAEEVRNEEEGIKWLTLAAGKEVSEADLVLGRFHAETRKNFTKAREHYKAAADRGSAAAQVELGILIQNGIGGGQSTEEAIELFKKAAARGSTEGAHYAGTILLNLQDKEKAVENILQGYQFLLAAAENRTRAQVDLALLYLSGRLGVSDPVSAAAWFDKAARLGDPVAQNNLATLYESGTGVRRDLPSALKLYGLALRKGNLSSATALGRFYARGTAVEKNLPKAWALFSIAAREKDEDALRLLGEITAGMSVDEIAEGKAELEKLTNPKPNKDDATTETPAEAKETEPSP